MMEMLLAGHARFSAGYWRRHEALYAELAQRGQAPKTMVIACADSRVAPEVIFDCAPGEIFVVRTVSNLVAPYRPQGGELATGAALEFAVTVLKVSTIVVLGHTKCGGIRALMRGPGNGALLDQWVAAAGAARARVCDAPAGEDFDALCARCEREAMLDSLRNLSGFPWIGAAVAARALTLAALRFDVTSGALERVA